MPKAPCAGISSLGMRSIASLPCSGQVALRSLLPQGKPEATVPFGAAGDSRRGRAGHGVVRGEAQLPALPRPWGGGCDLTVVQGPLQDGRVAGAPVADACEGQHLDLIQHVLAQACELGAAGRVPFHQPEPGWGVRVLLLVQYLSEPSAGSGPCSGIARTSPVSSPGAGWGVVRMSGWTRRGLVPGLHKLVLGEGGGHRDALKLQSWNFLGEHPARKTGPERGPDLLKVTQPGAAALGCLMTSRLGL